jgi:uncharacterized membrane protein YhhN
MNLGLVPAAPVAAFVATGAIALYGMERGRRVLAVVFKPVTTALLLAVVGPPASAFVWLVWVGLLASIAGDAALLRPGDKPFMVGLALFLVAHLLYVAAFVTVGAWSAWSWVGLALVAPATFLLLRALWPRVGALRVPVAAYAAAVSAMVVAAFSTVGGSLSAAPLAAVGGLLFYVSDASLAVNRFVRPLRYATLLSVGVYWLGQLGIAVAARLAGGG